MRKITTIEELMSTIEGCEMNYGFRKATAHDEEVMERGYLDCSVDMSIEGNYDYSEDCVLLGGTSSIGIIYFMDESEIIKLYKYTKETYVGKTILLVGDKCSEYGDDPGEIVLGHNGYGADVIAIVELN